MERPNTDDRVLQSPPPIPDKSPNRLITPSSREDLIDGYSHALTPPRTFLDVEGGTPVSASLDESISRRRRHAEYFHRPPVWNVIPLRNSDSDHDSDSLYSDSDVYIELSDQPDADHEETCQFCLERLPSPVLELPPSGFIPPAGISASDSAIVSSEKEIGVESSMSSENPVQSSMTPGELLWQQPVRANTVIGGNGRPTRHSLKDIFKTKDLAIGTRVMNEKPGSPAGQDDRRRKDISFECGLDGNSQNQVDKENPPIPLPLSEVERNDLAAATTKGRWLNRFGSISRLLHKTTRGEGKKKATRLQFRRKSSLQKGRQNPPPSSGEHREGDAPGNTSNSAPSA